MRSRLTYSSRSPQAPRLMFPCHWQSWCSAPDQCAPLPHRSPADQAGPPGDHPPLHCVGCQLGRYSGPPWRRLLSVRVWTGLRASNRLQVHCTAAVQRVNRPLYTRHRQSRKSELSRLGEAARWAQVLISPPRQQQDVLLPPSPQSSSWRGLSAQLRSIYSTAVFTPPLYYQMYVESEIEITEAFSYGAFLHNPPGCLCILCGVKSWQSPLATWQ